MKKIMVLLLGVVAAINAMAVDFTAKAKVTLTSETGYSCDLMLAEAAEFGALSGSKINMEGRVVALYVLNGEDSLQIANAADFRSVPLGVKLDASTKFSLSVSLVEGSETLYIHDSEADADYALTNGATYSDIVSTSTESRFYLKKASSGELIVCFTDNKLEIVDNPYDAPIIIYDAKGDKVAEYPAKTILIDLSSTGNPGDRFTVAFANGQRKRVIVRK